MNGATLWGCPICGNVVYMATPSREPRMNCPACNYDPRERGYQELGGVGR